MILYFVATVTDRNSVTVFSISQFYHGCSLPKWDPLSQPRVGRNRTSLGHCDTIDYWLTGQYPPSGTSNMRMWLILAALWHTAYPNRM
jgi:hypothetical protein